jgi:hypothetical protein
LGCAGPLFDSCGEAVYRAGPVVGECDCVVDDVARSGGRHVYRVVCATLISGVPGKSPFVVMP